MSVVRIDLSTSGKKKRAYQNVSETNVNFIINVDSISVSLNKPLLSAFAKHMIKLMICGQTWEYKILNSIVTK